MTTRGFATLGQARAFKGIYLTLIWFTPMLTACRREPTPPVTSAAPGPTDIRRYRVGDVFSFDGPADLGFSDATPVGTSAGLYWGEGMWLGFVLGDAHQRFLFGSEAKDVERRDDTIGGIPATVVSYRVKDGRYVERRVEAILHLSSKTTLSLRVLGLRADQLDRQLALVRSVTFGPSAPDTVLPAGHAYVCVSGEYCFDAPTGLDWRQAQPTKMAGWFISSDQIAVGTLWMDSQPRGERGRSFKQFAEYVENVPATIATYDLPGSELRYNVDAWFRHSADDIDQVHVETRSPEGWELACTSCAVSGSWIAGGPHPDPISCGSTRQVSRSSPPGSAASVFGVLCDCRRTYAGASHTRWRKVGADDWARWASCQVGLCSWRS